MPEISDNRYAELLKAESDVNRLKSDAENTAKALKKGREENNSLKSDLEEKDNAIKEKDELIASKDEELTKKDEKITEVEEIAKKWTDHEEADKKALTDNIEKMKTDLWDKFTDDVKGFIEDLPDAKVESYLKWLLPGDKSWKAPSTQDWKGWNPSGSNDPSKFDALVDWKNVHDINVNDMVSSLWAADTSWGDK